MAELPPRLFHLIVDDLTKSGEFHLRLTDGEERFLAANLVRLGSREAQWRGLLELDAYLEVETGRRRLPEELLNELGDFLTKKVFGSNIARHLFDSRKPGVLFVEIPHERRPEALELARIPWELAQSRKGPLHRYGLAVQIVPHQLIPSGAPLIEALRQVEPVRLNESLRVLLVFSQSRGQVALAMRDLRERLRTLFLGELAPRFHINLDILHYGATRVRIERLARRGQGYHIVHVVAHGLEDRLMLEHDDGRNDPITGEEFAALLSGAFAPPPRLVFLTACHSGEVRPESTLGAVWQQLRRLEAQPEAPEVDEEAPEVSYTGTAMAMLQAEIPVVIAMRYAVQETFAFDLAVDFYRFLLMEGNSPVIALGRSRDEALKRGVRQRYPAHSWITPVLFGGADAVAPFVLKSGRAPEASLAAIEGHLPFELRRIERFVGRTDEMRELRRVLVPDFDEATPLTSTILYGIGGMGKTGLAAEAIHLWHHNFERVYGWRPSTPTQPLSLDIWLQDLDHIARVHLGETDRTIWAPRPARDAPPEALGYWLEDRLSQLLFLLNTHRLLIVIDNFDANLRRSGEGPEAKWVCADPQWGKLLRHLANQLQAHRSRLLLTARTAPSELEGSESCLKLPVGPLPIGEWGVFARTTPSFQVLLHGDKAAQELLARALRVARGHPFLLEKLATMAKDQNLLQQQLQTFQAAGGKYANLPNLLASGRTEVERREEAQYLEDIAGQSVRTLLEDVISPEARRFLRVITLGEQPVDDGQIQRVWQAEGWERWRDELVREGLLARERRTGIELKTQKVIEAAAAVWHPIVQEQIVNLLPPATEGTDGFVESDYLGRYASCQLSDFIYTVENWRSSLQVEAAVIKGLRAVRYYLRKKDPEIASTITEMVRISKDLHVRRELQARFVALLQEVEADETREELILSLGEIYRAEGRPREALALYQDALASALAREDWRFCAIITHQMGNAFGEAANHRQGRARYWQALHYARRAPKALTGRLLTLGQLADLVRMDGHLARARRYVERLERIARAYYDQTQANPAAVEPRAMNTPEGVLGGILKVRCNIELAEEAYPQALATCTEMIKLKTQQHLDDLAVADSVHVRAICEIGLNDFGKAQGDLDFCLRLFRDHQLNRLEARVLQTQAFLAYEQGHPDRAVNFGQQAMAICHEVGALTDAVLGHLNLVSYYATLRQASEVLLQGCSAVIICCVLGREFEAAVGAKRLHNFLSTLSLDEMRSFWPTVAILIAEPCFQQLVADRMLTEDDVHHLLDDLWHNLMRLRNG